MVQAGAPVEFGPVERILNNGSEDLYMTAIEPEIQIRLSRK